MYGACAPGAALGPNWVSWNWSEPTGSTATISPRLTFVFLTAATFKSNSSAVLTLAAGWTAARRCRGASPPGLARGLEGARSAGGFRSRMTSGAPRYGAARIGAGWPCLAHAHAHRKPTLREKESSRNETRTTVGAAQPTPSVGDSPVAIARDAAPLRCAARVHVLERTSMKT